MAISLYFDFNLSKIVKVSPKNHVLDQHIGSAILNLDILTMEFVLHEK